jgi:hypothetical protein
LWVIGPTGRRRRPIPSSTTRCNTPSLFPRLRAAGKIPRPGG